MHNNAKIYCAYLELETVLWADITSSENETYEDAENSFKKLTNMFFS